MSFMENELPPEEEYVPPPVEEEVNALEDFMRNINGGWNLLRSEGS